MVSSSAVRRLRAEAPITSAIALAVAFALVLLASGPIVADAVSTSSLRRSLADAGTAETGIVIDGRLWLDEVEDADALVRRAVAAAFAEVDAEVVQSVHVSASYALPDQPSVNRTDLVRVGWVEEIEEHVAVTDGRLPLDLSPAGTIEVAVDATAAELLGLELGATVPLMPRTPTVENLRVLIVGLIRPHDRFSDFWHGRERLLEPVTVTSAFRTANLLTSRDAMVGELAVRPDVSWLVVPKLGDIELDEVAPLRRRVMDLESRINGGLFDPDVSVSPVISVETSLPDLLVGEDRTLAVSRAVIFATVAQLAALAAFTLTLVAGLGVDGRRSRSVMLRARGASPGQLTREAVIDAVVIVVPLALIAPLLATEIVGWFDEFGPLASIDLELDPRPVAAAWWTTAGAAAVTIGLLVAPVARAAFVAAAEGAVSRPRMVGPVQRSGLDLAILAAATFAYWQLRVLGDDQIDDLRGRLGVDPLVALAPMFGIIAGALLVLRFLPVLARLAERAVGARRGLVGALTVWQLARRPDRFMRTTLLVTMAVAIGSFTAVYGSTWTASQRARAEHEVAADIRVEPNRRIGDAVGPLQLTSVLSSVTGVETVMAVVELPSSLPGDEPDGRLMALEVDAIAALNAGIDPAVVAAIAELRAHRPEIRAVELPGTPVELVIPVSVTEVDRFGQPVIPSVDAASVSPLAGALAVTVQDGDGMFHVLSAGALAVDDAQRSIPLATSHVGSTALPRPPIRIVDVQLETVTQGAIGRFVDVSLGPVDVVDVDGSVTTIGFSDLVLALDTERYGFLASPASATVTTSDSGSLRIAAATGSSLSAVRVIHTVADPLLPGRAPVAGLADRRWATGVGVSVGDVVDIRTDRIDDVRVEVVGLVDAVPGVDPAAMPAVLVDLPSLQWHERTPGRASRDASQYWLGTERTTDLGAESFLRPPVEAVDVTVLDDRRSELIANPPALGSLGVLGAGFLASVVLAVTALVLAAIVSVRERAANIAVLEALGLSRAKRRRWLLSEQTCIVLFGVVAGIGIGLGLAQLVLPVTSLAQDGGSMYPDVVMVTPWPQVAVLATGVGSAALIAVGAALGFLMQGRSVKAHRPGAER